MVEPRVVIWASIFLLVNHQQSLVDKHVFLIIIYKIQIGVHTVHLHLLALTLLKPYIPTGRALQL